MPTGKRVWKFYYVETLKKLISCSLKLGFKIRPLKTQLVGPSRLSVRKYKVWRNVICIISFNLQPQSYYIQRNRISEVKRFERYRIRSLSSWHCKKKTKATIDLSKVFRLRLANAWSKWLLGVYSFLLVNCPEFSKIITEKLQCFGGKIRFKCYKFWQMIQWQWQSLESKSQDISESSNVFPVSVTVWIKENLSQN